MRAYLLTSAVVFGLVVFAHVIRAVVEGPELWKQPPFILTTIAAACLFGWAMSLIRKSGGSGQ